MLVLGPHGRCRPRSVAACAFPWATWYEQQSDRQMVAICPGLGGAWERLIGELRLDATSGGFGAAKQRHGAQ